MKFAICDNSDGSRGYYAKGNKSEKDKYDLIQWNLYKQNENRLIDTENKWVVARRWGSRRVGEVGEGN